jgi:N-acetylmuramoyl-L-alanine amidase
MELLSINRSVIAKIELYGGRSKQTAQQVLNSLSEKPDYIINGMMYDRNSGMTVADTIIDKVVINGGNYTPKGIGFNNASDFTECTTNEAKAAGFNYFMGGSPNLLWDGELNIDRSNAYGGKPFTAWDVNIGKAIRIGVGFTNDELVFYFPSKKTTIKAVGQYLLNYGCKAAINLDGGGSTKVCKVEDGKLVNLNEPTENRANSTWILIYLHKEKSVVLDPGHGDTDYGMVGIHGTHECDVTLSVAHMVKQYLESAGVRVHMSREGKHGKDITSRISEANKTKADAYVSLHCKPTEGANASLGVESHVYSKDGEGSKLASPIHTRLAAATGYKNKGIRVSKYQELTKTVMPAAFIEMGNIMDESTEVDYRNASFRMNKLAKPIAQGICEYLGVEFLDVNVEDEYPLTELVIPKEPVIEDDWMTVSIKSVCEKYNLDTNQWLSMKDAPITVGQFFGIMNKLLK